ncbi:MAG: ABC transporter ATP-binding protein [Thermodesulfobacteriota bacterium]|nr:ABC transporter ATP-binding protein [Thermodesulfobacteriota bacterium]
MPDVVIKVENLSKQYRIGVREGYRTFRETLADAAKAPFQRLWSAFTHTTDTTDQTNATNGTSRTNQTDMIWALRDVSFEVKQGEVVGIIGRNGAGKSTLLKILSEITEPTEGRVELRGRVGSLLEVGTGFHPELSGHENVYLYAAILGMDRYEVTRKFDEIVAFAELEKFIDTPVKRYSSGMYMRLAFAVAAHLEPEILLVDEVLAVGDIGFQKKCLGKMGDVSKEGRTVLFVSHNMAAVNSLCEKSILLENGTIEKSGPSNEIISYYREKTLEDIVADTSEPGLWPSRSGLKGEGAVITAVEMLDPLTGYRKDTLATTDTVAFRLHFHSQIDLREASFQFGLSSEDNRVLIDYYTQPNDGVETPLRKGKGHIDCTFRQFPLAAGNYFIMVGIAHTMVKWLFRSEEFGRLRVSPFLAPGTRRALTSDTCYFYTEHRWRMWNDHEEV